MPAAKDTKFREKNRQERIDAVKKFAGLSDADAGVLADPAVPFETINGMVENAVGFFALPLGIATNFRINGRDHMVPMAIEEPSVIAAASAGAKAALPDGFTAKAGRPLNTGQIQVLDVDPSRAAPEVMAASGKILALANSKSRTLPAMGRGAVDLACREIHTDAGPMLIVELAIDVADAMGANITNTMCEAVAPLIGEITGGRVLLRILSNYSTRRLARASAVFASGKVGGDDVVNNIILAYQFAKHDVYRAVTHNKGVMNGVIAVANATGQDGRAIEAAAGAYAARNGAYGPLAEWSRNGDGDLVGTLELPLSVGIVGGITGVHPTAGVCTRMLGVRSAQELACVMASVGLAQNYSALRALATDGIQKGHMRLHARNVAAAAGAGPDKIDRIVDGMVDAGDISPGRARRLLGELDNI